MLERWPQLAYEDLPSAVRPLADDILKVSSAAPGGPYNALLRSPEALRAHFRNEVDTLGSLLIKTGMKAS